MKVSLVGNMLLLFLFAASSLLASGDPNDFQLLSKTAGSLLLADSSGSAGRSASPVVGIVSGPAEGKGGDAPPLDTDGEDLGLAEKVDQATASVTLDGSGNLVVVGSSDSGSSDNLIIHVDPETNELVVSDPDNVVATLVSDATQTDPHEIRFASGAFTGDLIIDTGDGDDTITLGDLSELPGSVRVDGGNGFNSIILGEPSGATVILATDADLSLSAENIRVFGASVTVSGAGEITLTSQGSGDGTFQGVSLIKSNLTSGNGAITLTGEGGTGGGYNSGVKLDDATVTSQSGHIIVTGLGGGSGSISHGIHVLNGSTLSAGDGAAITLTGRGAGGTGSNTGIVFSHDASASVVDGDLSLVGSGDGSGSLSKGILLQGGSFTSSGSGDILIQGTGAGTETHGTGVEIISDALVETSGSGSIEIEGAGAAGGIHYNRGVVLHAGTTVRCAQGALSIKGVGGGSGAGIYNQGVALLSGVLVEVSSGTGPLRVEGAGGAADSYNSGVFLQAAVTLRSNDGNLLVEGTSDGTGASNHGVQGIGATLEVNGSGSLLVQGIGSASSSGAGSEGVSFALGSVLSTTVGDLVLEGTGGTGTDHAYGVHLLDSSASAGTGALLITGSGNAATTGTSNTGIFIQRGELEGGAGSSFKGIGGGGERNNHGVYLDQIITDSLDESMTAGTAGEGDSEDSVGKFSQ